MGMNAQEKLVKEVEKEIGAAKYATLSEKLKPAFTDATSEKDAYTWFVAAKVEMNEFDELFKQKMIGKSVDATVLGKHLLAGIDYLKKVLPLDTVPEVDKKTGAPKVDKKTGLVKVKTRFSKNVVSMLAENYSPLNSIMSEIHNAKDYANISVAYTVCEKFSSATVFEKNVQNTVYSVCMKAARAKRAQARRLALKWQRAGTKKNLNDKYPKIQHNSASLFGNIELV
jgi:hypothetical protein